MNDKIKTITKLEDGSLEIKYESGNIGNLPGEVKNDFSKSYNNLTVQAALIFCIVNKGN